MPYGVFSSERSEIYIDKLYTLSLITLMGLMPEMTSDLSSKTFLIFKIEELFSQIQNGKPTDVQLERKKTEMKIKFGECILAKQSGVKFRIKRDDGATAEYHPSPNYSFYVFCARFCRTRNAQ